MEEKDESFNELINDKGVCRTASATLGLLVINLHKIYIHFFLLLNVTIFPLTMVPCSKEKLAKLKVLILYQHKGDFFYLFITVLKSSSDIGITLKF